MQTDFLITNALRGYWRNSFDFATRSQNMNTPATYRGFIQLAPMGYAVLILGTFVLILGMAVKVQTARLDSVKKQYADYRATVEAIGRAQEAKNKAEIEQRKKVTDARIYSLQKRLNDTTDKFNRLRESGSGQVPAVPDTARPVDDTARDSRLLDVLQHAQKQTDQLIELQGWVREQQQVK